MSRDKQMPILICGASFAGLCLARQLSARGVPFLLFEGKSEGQIQRHRFRFHAWAYEPLLKCLGISLDELCKRVAVDANMGGIGSPDSVAYDIESGSFKRSTGEDDTFRANRGLLTELLRRGLEIRYNHRLKGFKSSPEGIIAEFEGGQTYQGSLLAACDGVHSNIRCKSLPDQQFQIHNYVVYYGQQHLSLDEYKTRYGEVLDGATKLGTSRNGQSLAISINELADKTRIGYTYSRRARSIDDPLLRPGREKDSAHQIPRQLWEEFDELGKSLPEPFQSLCDSSRMQREDKLVHWLMRSLRIPPNALEVAGDQRVALLGDAAHPMPLLTADGANLAILDGLELGQTLSDSGDVIGQLKRFYRSAASRWESTVAEAEKRLQEMHPRPSPHAKS